MCQHVCGTTLTVVAEGMRLRVVDGEVVVAWSPKNGVVTELDTVADPVVRMSMMALERIGRTVSLVLPIAVVLSVTRGVALWGYPRSASVNRVGVPSSPLKKSAANSDSDSEAVDTTVGMSVLRTSMAPLTGADVAELLEVSMWRPPARERECGSDR